MKYQKVLIVLLTICFTGWVSLSCHTNESGGGELNDGLIGYWKLDGDGIDYSGNNLHAELIRSRNRPDSGSVNDTEHNDVWHQVSASSKLKMDDDFSISVWIDALSPGRDVSGDIISQYDVGRRKGFHLSLTTNPSPTGVGNSRRLRFGMDNNIASEWMDCGRPGQVLLAFGLAEYNGDLYASTCEPEAGGAGHVYRYDSENNTWKDCGAPDRSNTVFALTEYKGDLYAATGKYRVAGSSLPESANTAVGGRIFRYDGPGKWVDCGQLPGVEAIIGLVVYKDELYASSLYSPGLFKYEADNTWTRCSTPDGKRIQSFGVYDGHLFATSYDLGHVYRFDGTEWVDCGQVGQNNTQTYGFSVYQGELYVSSWPSGKVYAYEDIKQWRDVGRLGEELEVMGVIVYNGQLLGGTLPMAEAYRYQGDTTWQRMDQLDTTENVKYRRAWTMTEHDGRVYCSTLPSGHIYAYKAGETVVWRKSFPEGWHHVVVSKSANKLSLYVGGELVDQKSIPTSDSYHLSSGSPFNIGFGQHDVFQGRIKELRMYNRVLTKHQIDVLGSPD